MKWNIIICKMTYILVLLAFGIIGSSALVASNLTCPAGTILCNGTCINTSVDLLNCGSCGNACPAGTACVKGNCSCLVGLELCNGTCTETSFDSRNCGSCGYTCPLGKDGRDPLIGLNFMIWKSQEFLQAPNMID